MLLTELPFQNVVGSVEDMQNFVGPEVVGSVDKIQDVLDIVLCDHESPRDQNLADPSDNDEQQQQQQQQPPAASATTESNCKRQHQPSAVTEATAIVEAPAPALASTITFSELASMTEARAKTCISATHWDATVPRAAQCQRDRKDVTFPGGSIPVPSAPRGDRR